MDATNSTKKAPGAGDARGGSDDIIIPHGLPAEHWLAIGAKRVGDAWHIPERNGDGEIIGTAIRPDHGTKHMVPGSSRGLTMKWPLDKYAGTTADDPVLIVEGQTDTAAGLCIGFDTVGRPSAMGGLEHLKILCKNRHVTICGENDGKGSDDDNRPGKIGADKIADGLRSIAASVKIIFPPANIKDLCDWVTGPAGADHAEVLAAIRAVEVWEPEPEPADLPERPLEYQAFPVDALPKPAANMAKSVAAMIGCDPVYAALPTVIVMAALIGTTRRLMIQYGHYAPSVLWGAIISRSGTAKSPAADAIKEPLEKLQKRRIREYVEALEQHERELIEYRAEVKEYERKTSKGEPDGQPPTEPDRPAQIRYASKDATIEALCSLLADNPKGIGYLPDELTAWTGAFDKYKKGGKGGSDRAQWLSMYDAREVIVDRKGEVKPIYVPHAAVSVYGTIQPRVAAQTFDSGDRDSGLVARLLLVYPRQRAMRWTGRNLNAGAERRWAELCERLIDLHHNHDEDGELIPRLVRLSDEARRHYAAFYDEQADRWEQTNDEDVQAAISKLRAVAARLALIIHVARHAGGEAVDPDVVDADSMSRAITLARWHTNEAERVYAMLSESDEDRASRQNIEMIQRRGNCVSVRDWQRARSHKSAADAERNFNRMWMMGADDGKHRHKLDAAGPPRFFA